MGYAVELFFDDDSAQKVCGYWDDLASHIGHKSLSEWDARPHVTLAVYNDDLDTEVLPEKLCEFAESTNRFGFSLNSLGTFPGDVGAVVFFPVVTHDLLNLHKNFHQDFIRYGAFTIGHYLPGNWVPHCTVANDLKTSQISEAVAFIQTKLEPVPGTFQKISLVEFRPIKELATFNLR